MQLYEQQYLQYAHVRLADEGLGAEAVERTFGYLSGGWDAVLRCPQPMAACWVLLRQVVSERSRRASRTGDRLHRALPALAADAALLRYRLGLDASIAAHLMGVDESALRAQLRTATSMLARV
ncbi:hypothetical protein OH807_30905 [Kitasatospora sp. NBC_01560]|uniref:hypothetical protein n=1 Tax=Kitasatospora sp. NBC_01560 TaxID=2975965 RepID=UPI00386AE854